MLQYKFTSVSYLQEMTLEEKQLITDLNKCDFGELHAMHKQRVEDRKNMSKEEKQVSVRLEGIFSIKGPICHF